MHERVLRVAFQRRPSLALDELLAGEAVEELLGALAGDAAQLRHRVEPEHLAEHRGVLDERLLLLAQRVETRGDQPLDGFGQRECLGAGERVALERDPRELLGVERVSACPLQEPAWTWAGRTARWSRPCTSVAVSASVSGDSEIVVAFGLPAPHPGRRVSSSGRAVATTRIGTSAAQSIR